MVSQPGCSDVRQGNFPDLPASAFCRASYDYDQGMRVLPGANEAMVSRIAAIIERSFPARGMGDDLRSDKSPPAGRRRRD